LHTARLAAPIPNNIQILDFTPEADMFIAAADRVVGMAGYNTVCSILSFARPALLVPRVTPRREQWIRAERLSKLGMVDFIAPEQLNPGNLAAWLQQPVVRFSTPGSVVDLNGLDRVVEWIASLLPGGDGRSGAAPTAPRNPK
jgi:predicted glycosyltransferase